MINKGVKMKNETIISVPYVTAQIFLLLTALLLTCVSPALGAPAVRPQPAVQVPAHNIEILKILPVLELKIEDRKLLEKSKEKIFAMDDRELHLVAALCEKISDEKKAVSSDIAFLLVTALIVLS